MKKNYDLTKADPDAQKSDKRQSVQLSEIKTNGESYSEQGDDASQTQSVSFLQLFRFADGLDKTLMICGAIGGLLQAIGMQLLPILIFTVVNQISDIIIEQNTTNISLSSPELAPEVLDLIPQVTIPLAGVIAADLIFAFLTVALWSYTAERQTQTVRRLAFNRIIHMHIGWYDAHLGGELNSRLAEDASRYQSGLGDKVGLVIHWFCMFVVALTFALIVSWQVTLVTLATMPVVIGAAALSAWSAKASAELEGNAYAKAGAVAEEALANIRIVSAFSGELYETKQYEDFLGESKAVAIKSGAVTALSQGLSWLIIFSITALIYWYGGSLVDAGDLPPGNIFMIFMMMVSGSRSLAFAAPNLEAINAAKSSAYALYDIIDQKSTCDSSLPTGKKPKGVRGEVGFRNIHFSYPARKDVPVLKGLTFTIRPGQTAALVGPSGCGKSTTIQLLQRLYDPDIGQVTLDGTHILDLNLPWLRDQIGVVSQEPILFATTIAENIKFGREGSTMEEVIACSKEASAHDFIMKLPNRYETVLNEQGTQLSRGEKQRISLARALIRKPRILLLDECTSALDTESEAIVQKALDKASAGRTTIVIAHRLSTVRNSDIIFIINKGVLEECGNHDELMAKKGLYSVLVKTQVGDDDGGDKKGPVDKKDEKERADSKARADSRARNKQLDKITRERSGSIASVISSMLDIDTEDPSATNAAMKDLEDNPPVAWSRLLEKNSPEWPYLLLGGICAVLSGLVWPSFAIFFGLVVEALIIPESNEADWPEGWLTSSAYALFTIILGLLAATIQFLMNFAFKVAGEGLTHRLRVLAFATMLRQEIGWFDEEKNQVGTLTSKLANEASRVKMATGQALATMLQASSTAIFSAALALTLSWQLGLCMLPLIPLGAAVTLAQGYFNRSFAQKSQQAIESSGKIASEAMDKIRTVIALNKEDYFKTKYQKNFTDMLQAAKKRAAIMGTTWALMWFVAGMNYIIGTGFGLWLVANGLIEFHFIYSVLAANVFAALELGRANAYAPEFTSAKAAAARMFAVYDRESKLDPLDPSGQKPAATGGDLKLVDVFFRFPTRPSIEVINDVSMGAIRGESVAMCGPSGSGKSAIVQLMERFYDVLGGRVELDGVDVRNLNVEWFRRQISIVTQEPILFAKTIAENIAYGDNTRKIPMEEIIEAAKSANIHNFIATLPLGYDTNVGGKGTQLSGGQKQRLSIARALVRNPKILLLDDCTSALDSESEKVVEIALQKARMGRTCIVVSHRLSSIVNASQICYVDKGQIMERGTHEELMAKKAYYYDLQQASLGHRRH